MQQRTDQDLKGRELIGYTYSLDLAGIPTDPDDVVNLGAKMFPFWDKHQFEMRTWLPYELACRLSPATNLDQVTEKVHPALLTTIEGNWPAYTYTERMLGLFSSMDTALNDNRDTRRAFWPIFRVEDAVRASAPTRIPCSLGYEFLIRNTPQGERMLLYYLQRSADFDTFFLSDIWLASMLQREMAERHDVAPGQLFHTIISLHSFAVEGMEIY